MKIHMALLPDEVQRLINDFPQLEVILNNLATTETGDVLEIMNLHDKQIKVLLEDVSELDTTSTDTVDRIVTLESNRTTDRTDIDDLVVKTNAKTDGIMANGTLIKGNPKLVEGKNIKFLVDDAKGTITISASGTNATEGIPIGTISFFSAITPPIGWLEADGRLLDRSEYSELFDVIGTTFGAGDGSTTFNLPDLRGQFVRGWDHNRGLDSGRGFGTDQDDELKSHIHTSYYDDADATATSGEHNGWDSSGPVASHRVYQDTSATGGTETRPKNIALLPCIRVKGIESSLTSAIGVMQARMDTVEPIILDNQTQVSGIKSKLNGVDLQIAAIQTGISGLQSVDEGINQQLALIRQSIDSMRLEISEIRGTLDMAYVTPEQLKAATDRIDTLESSVTGLQTSIDALTKSVSDLTTTTSSLGGAIDSLSTRLDGYNELLAETRIDISHMSDDIVALEDRVTTLETPPESEPEPETPVTEEPPAEEPHADTTEPTDDGGTA